MTAIQASFYIVHLLGVYFKDSEAVILIMCDLTFHYSDANNDHYEEITVKTSLPVAKNS